MPSTSPSKRVQLFHTLKADECELVHAAFDNRGNLYILKATNEFNGGKLELDKTYRVKSFHLDGNIVTLNKYTSVSPYTIASLRCQTIQGFQSKSGRFA